MTTANATFAAKLIDVNTIKWLLPTTSAFTFKLHGRNLLVWCHLLSATALAGLFDTAKSFTGHIPRQIWAEYGTRQQTLAGGYRD